MKSRQTADPPRRTPHLACRPPDYAPPPRHAKRLRRLRTAPAMRRLVSETTLRPRQLILPMFVAEGLEQPRPIASMPGVVQHTRDTLRKAAVDAVNAGVGGLMLFGIPAKRDAEGSGGVDEKGIL